MRSNCSVFEDLGGRDLPSSRPVPRPPGFASISSIFLPSDHLGPPAVLRGRNTRRCGRVRKSRRDESSRRPLYDRSAGSARQRQWRTATCIASTVPQSWQRKVWAPHGTCRSLGPCIGERPSRASHRQWFESVRTTLGNRAAKRDLVEAYAWLQVALQCNLLEGLQIAAVASMEDLGGRLAPQLRDDAACVRPALSRS